MWLKILRIQTVNNRLQVHVWSAREKLSGLENAMQTKEDEADNNTTLENLETRIDIAISGIVELEKRDYSTERKTTSSAAECEA